jgi:hypothetical protein
VESVATPPVKSVNGGDYMDATAPKAVGKSKGGEGMRLGLELYQKTFPHMTAILVGTRRTDPHGGMAPIPSTTQRWTYVCPSTTITSKYDRPALAQI